MGGWVEFSSFCRVYIWRFLRRIPPQRLSITFSNGLCLSLILNMTPSPKEFTNICVNHREVAHKCIHLAYSCHTTPFAQTNFTIYSFHPIARQLFCMFWLIFFLQMDFYSMVDFLSKWYTISMTNRQSRLSNWITPWYGKLIIFFFEQSGVDDNCHTFFVYMCKM